MIELDSQHFVSPILEVTQAKVSNVLKLNHYETFYWGMRQMRIKVAISLRSFWSHDKFLIASRNRLKPIQVTLFSWSTNDSPLLLKVNQSVTNSIYPQVPTPSTKQVTSTILHYNKLSFVFLAQTMSDSLQSYPTTY